MNCPHCQKDVAISREYCPYCGKRMQMQFNEIASSVHDDAAIRRGESIERFLGMILFILVLAGTILYGINDLYDRQLVFEASDLPAIPAPSPKMPDLGGVAVRPFQDVQGVKSVAAQAPVAFGYRFEPIKSQLIKANGGLDPRAVKEIHAGLRYLSSKQTTDGYFLVDARDLRIVAAHNLSANYEYAKVGLTGLAMLPFLAECELWTTEGSTYASNLRRGLAYLLKEQDPATGRYGPAPQQGFFMLNHALALLAVSEAAGMTGDVWLRDSAQRGVDMLERIQGPNGGWGDSDSVGADRTENTFSTAWQVQALYAAREAGLKVNPDVLRKALSFMQSVTNPDGLVVYDKKDSNTKSLRNILSAITLFSREQLGEAKITLAHRALINKIIDKDSLPGVEKGWGPFWQESSPGVDQVKRAATFEPYRWYCQTYAMFLRGGDDWTLWQPSMQHAVMEMADTDGAWRGNDVFSCQYGPVWSTAFSILCLQAQYRMH